MAMPNRYQSRPGILLAVDPSPNGTGFGVLDFEGDIWKPLAWGELKQGHQKHIDLEVRALRAAKYIRKAIRDYKPEVIVIEKIEGTIWALQRDWDTTVAQLKQLGAIQGKADELGIPVKWLTPGSWKSHCGVVCNGDRSWQKLEAIRLAKIHFEGVGMVSEGAAEALLIGKTYAEKHAVNELRQGRLF